MVIYNDQIKHVVLYIFLCAELGVMIFFYFFGAQGIFAITRLKSENRAIQHNITQLQQEVAHLEQSIREFEKYSYFKEKIAREHLHMACKDDIVYYIENS